MTRLVLAGLFLCSTLSAQMGRDFFPWWDTPVARDLALSEEQTRQIQGITREYRDKLIDLRATVEKADNHLSDLMDEEKPDQQRAYAAIDRLSNARSDLTKLYSQMAFRLRAVLTPAQWRDLQKKRPMPGGPRPMPGPGANRPRGDEGKPPRPHNNDEAVLDDLQPGHPLGRKRSKGH